MKKIIVLFTSLLFFSCNMHSQETKENTTKKEMSKQNNTYKIQKTEAQWKAQLNDEQYRVLREKGTERPHTGQYNLHFEEGTYTCAGCNEKLFESDTKFDAHCGWPSFDKAIEGKVEYKLDKSHGMTRTEILCKTCGSHLGHVFNDGPTPTGMRYCVNSVSLDFEKSKNE